MFDHTINPERIEDRRSLDIVHLIIIIVIIIIIMAFEDTTQWHHI